MLTDIRALADHFLITLPNINNYQFIEDRSGISSRALDLYLNLARRLY